MLTRHAKAYSSSCSVV